MSSNYIVLKGGIFSPQNDKLNQFGTGFNGEIAFGHYFNRYFALEAGTGYFQTSRTTDTYAEANLNFNVIPLTIAFKGIIPLDKFELYGIGGGGAYFLWTNTNASGDDHYYRSNYSDSKTLVGGFLGLGASVKVSSKVFLGLEGKYLWTSTVTINNYNNTYSYNTDVNMNGIIVTLNVGFLF
jgi:opacity protein-like surface antigen